MNSAENNKYRALADIFLKITNIPPSKRLKVLVIGAGMGFEVIALKRYFEDIIAIEPRYNDVIKEARPYVKASSAVALKFPDESFDVVYCYHVLEHIREHEKAIFEICRVLKKGGLFYLGVPNKLRVAAYICLSDISFKTKIKCILQDWKLRIMGKFENRLGAHAGFTKEELIEDLRPFFSAIENKTDAYYFYKYTNNIFVKMIIRMGFLKRYLWPSLYFICKK
jgi:ubiquinone/menaquinone biosynthesis C-methylase UbiE